MVTLSTAAENLIVNSFAGIKTIEGLDRCVHLEQLWLPGNEISRIEGLQHCVKVRSFIHSSTVSITLTAKCLQLRELYLSENRITKIENLGHLSSLEVLELNDNLIASLEGSSLLLPSPAGSIRFTRGCSTGVPVMKKLQRFGLASNKIHRIGSYVLDSWH